MVVHNLHASRLAFGPPETEAVLVIDPYAVLAGTVAAKGFKSVAGRRLQVAQILGIVQVNQFASRRFLNRPRQFFRDNALKDFFRLDIGKGFNHTLIISHDDTMVNSDFRSRLQSKFAFSQRR